MRCCQFDLSLSRRCRRLRITYSSQSSVSSEVSPSSVSALMPNGCRARMMVACWDDRSPRATNFCAMDKIL
ncbi:hypothetical protein HYQ46_002598 [Verticillium longisporum]|nr:hypothetical protein HYQ46_002598 [Verticillium longisporum]